ncbi:Ribosome-releasing factor 2, mitochondrial [Ceratobasidium sp. 428]|nr:Ribosome-releasing factor 2, mitochondrial [Ceratobasidium sp. 428]
MLQLGRRISSYALRPQTSTKNLRLSSTISGPTSTLPSNPENIRNIALLAHIDSGKTTLTESILAASSYKPEAGTVDTGSTTTDFLPAERERGITIQSASIPVIWKQWTFNLIDTPGHADFGMEVESASRVVDGAVVLMDGVEGVESQTKGVWSQLDRHRVPTRFMFINKLDRPGASLPASISSVLAHRLHPAPTLLTLPIASFDPGHYARGEPGIEGLVDLVKWEVWRWSTRSDSSTEPERLSLPTTETALAEHSLLPSSHPLGAQLLPAREALLDSLSLRSPELESALLESPPDISPYLSVKDSDIITALRSLVARQNILPVFCGAAAKHIGTKLLMDYIGELLASPRDVRLEGAVESGSDVQMLAWKVAWDKRKGWMTFVRVYSGTLFVPPSIHRSNYRSRLSDAKYHACQYYYPRERTYLQDSVTICG